jgi:hypothetical protein
MHSASHVDYHSMASIGTADRYSDIGASTSRIPADLPVHEDQVPGGTMIYLNPLCYMRNICGAPVLDAAIQTRTRHIADLTNGS